MSALLSQLRAEMVTAQRSGDDAAAVAAQRAYDRCRLDSRREEPPGHVELALPCSMEEADWGVGPGNGPGRYYRNVLVEPDGSVLAWDELAYHYTRVHSLGPELVEQAQRSAELVRSGEAYTAGGHLFPRIKGNEK